MNTKFLGLQIDNHINWKNHVEEMIAKLYNNLPTNAHLLIFTELFCIKNNKNSYMFQSMRDHHHRVCTTLQHHFVSEECNKHEYKII